MTTKMKKQFQKSFSDFNSIEEDNEKILSLFEFLKGKMDKVSGRKIVKTLKEEGLDVFSDPRLEQLHIAVDETNPDIFFTYKGFQQLLEMNKDLIKKTLLKSLAIQHFEDFAARVRNIYESIKKDTEGQVSSHIPEMCKVSLDLWGVTICSVDGQKLRLGNWDEPFTIQSCNKPFMYGLALESLGYTFVHSFTGHEPTNKKHDAIILDKDKKPHNALVNIGAIVICGLIQNNALPKMTVSDKHEFITTVLKKLSGGAYVQFKNSVYISEKERGHQNKALAHYLQSENCFPAGCDVEQALDFYFTSCSLEVSSESLSVMAATLANGGVCPLTGEKIFSQETVKNILSLMRTGGMYNYSGEFGFLVGLPAKACASGGVFLVVPGILGVGLYSPALDVNGNSVRGVKFCKDFVEEFKFHPFFDVCGEIKRSSAVMKLPEIKCTKSTRILSQFANEDIEESINFLRTSMRHLHMKNTDNHNALHVAVVTNKVDCVRYLIDNYKYLLFDKDNWSRLPLDLARIKGNDEVAKMLESSMSSLEEGDSLSLLSSKEKSTDSDSRDDHISFASED